MCEVHNKDLFFDLQQDAVFERERKETNERMSPSVPSGSRVQEGGGTTFPAIARAGGKDSHENGLEAAGWSSDSGGAGSHRDQDNSTDTQFAP